MLVKLSFRVLLVLFAFSCWARIGQSQVIIIDRRPEIPIARSFEVKDVTVDAAIRDQVAEVRVAQTFHNPGAFALEAEYYFPLPAEGAIQNLVLMVDGKELPGRLLPKDEARAIYETIVRQKRDPALMEFMGCGLFRTSVFPIPPGADRQVSVRYTQLCRRDGAVVDFLYPMTAQKITGKPIGKFTLSVRLASQTPIKSIYSPTHEPQITRGGDHEATLKLEASNLVPSTDFRLLYTLEGSAIGATLLSTRPSEKEDGTFLLLASPQIKRGEAKPRPKAVIFALDRSGSMAGAKLDQAKDALRFVLNHLGEGDAFNIIIFDDQVESFKSEPQPFTPTLRAEADRYIDSIQSGGGTNIDAALLAAMGMIKNAQKPSYVLFMTDGLPTAGETGEKKIAEQCQQANKFGARLFAFGVGFDVNARLLDRLSGASGGTTEYVRPAENIEAHVATFYSRLTSPVLTGIKMEATRGDLRQVYPERLPDLFEGGQLVVAGRYRQGGAATLRLTGLVGGQSVHYEYPVTFAAAGEATPYQFTERLWAMRRVGALIDQIDLNGENKELTDELVKLSRQYGILTPYTSFLADEDMPLANQAVQVGRSRMLLGGLRQSTGQAAQAQRLFKGELMRRNAPEAAMSIAAADAMPAPASVAPGMSPPTSVSTAKASHREAGRAMRQVGAKTFFYKDGCWIDAQLSENDLKNAVKIEQFSEPYFKLARTLSPDSSGYLAFDEPVLLRLEGKNYWIHPPGR